MTAIVSGDRLTFLINRVSVLRFLQEWVRRDGSQVLALRSTLSWGLDAFGATVQGGSTEDGQFLAWLGQFQWARRFEPWAIEGIVRTDLQLASDPLLPLEQFSVGGAASVRGYRENQLVRDMGFASSLELRIPLWRSREGGSSVQLAPFVDVGRAWNTKRSTPGPKTLSSAGVGLRVALFRRLRGELYWAEEIRGVNEPSDRDLQDTGVHFRLAVDLFSEAPDALWTAATDPGGGPDGTPGAAGRARPDVLLRSGGPEAAPGGSREAGAKAGTLLR